MPRLLVFIILNASPLLYFSSILPHCTNSFLLFCSEIFWQDYNVLSYSEYLTPQFFSLYHTLQNNNNIETISPCGKDGKDLPFQSLQWLQECIRSLNIVRLSHSSYQIVLMAMYDHRFNPFFSLFK
jgi:hypothetical protein